MPARPFKARNETLEKSASALVWPPEWRRDNCRASEARPLARKLGPQRLPEGIQIGREEGFVFALASLCGFLSKRQACLGPRVWSIIAWSQEEHCRRACQDTNPVRGRKSC